jgi:BirA family biotin operon repressor/biotin-[acetyl-CoA-carboxylase] ligase
MPPPEIPLDIQRIDAALAPTRFAGSIAHFATVTSTNTLALEAAQSGVAAGVWIADQQTAGRGRGGHTWHSALGASTEPDGLYLSALVRPSLPIAKALWLSLAAGLAAQHAIAATTGLTPDLRWPNDLMVPQPNGPSRKLGGILVETASNPATTTQPATLRYAIIGIGINLNQHTFPPELESIATSIARETGAPPSRESLIVALLTALDREIAQLEAASAEHHTAPDLLARFTAASTWVTGKRVRIQPTDTGPSYTGITAGLDPQGFLLVRSDDGQLRTVLSGGVREP